MIKAIPVCLVLLLSLSLSFASHFPTSVSPFTCSSVKTTARECREVVPFPVTGDLRTYIDDLPIADIGPDGNFYGFGFTITGQTCSGTPMYVTSVVARGSDPDFHVLAIRSICKAGVHFRPSIEAVKFDSSGTMHVFVGTNTTGIGPFPQKQLSWFAFQLE